MTHWTQDLLKLFKVLLAILGIVFVIFILNQFLLLYQFFSQLHPIAGGMVVALIAIGLTYLLIRIYQLWFRGNKHIVLPDNPTREEYEEYLSTMVDILAQNPNLQHLSFDKSQEPHEVIVTRSFQELDNLSQPMIRENANSIFLSTAISQNGVLDSFMVLFTMVRMIWQLADLYQTRPSLASMAKLYAQVAGVVLMARTIEDTDLIEAQMEPLITAILGESIASAIPGMVPITNIIVSSLMEGSINAFLTLRVGLITQAYLGMESPQAKNTVRFHTSRAAIKEMGAIIKDNGKLVVKVMAKATKNAGVGTAKRWFTR